MSTTTTSIEQLRTRLEAIGQAHLLAFADRLSEDERSALVAQIGSIELERVPTWIERYVQDRGEQSVNPDDIEPASYYPADPATPGSRWDRDAARARGESLLRAGGVAAFTVAGGQGTRLGYDGPKGTFPATPVTKKPLFAVLAESLIAAARKYERAVPWYIMTSPLNHQQTIDFFERQRHFGLDPAEIFFFSQGVMPSFDRETGRMLLATPHTVATNPDGHGGSLKALYESGAIADMKRRGIEHISYVQIDNPLAKLIDPVFLGLHAGADDSSGEMSSKMVAKTDPAERVGVFCSIDGRTEVIEYSDLPAELAAERDEHGALRYNAGSIAIHAIGVEFVERLNTGAEGFSLPFHRAEKKVPCIDPETGEPIEPDSPNGVKLETFVFDALAMCESSIVYETRRVEEFAPIKNAEGTDSPATSAALQSARAADWLERAGVAVPRRDDGSPDCTIELSPITALEPDDLAKRNDLPGSIERAASIAL